MDYLSQNALLWLVFLLIGLATTVPRASFIVMGHRVQLPLVVYKALRYAPAAALAAIVAPDVFITQGQVHLFSPKLLAIVAVTGISLSSKNPWLPFLVGMGVLLALRNGAGWL